MCSELARGYFRAALFGESLLAFFAALDAVFPIFDYPSVAEIIVIVVVRLLVNGEFNKSTTRNYIMTNFHKKHTRAHVPRITTSSQL